MSEYDAANADATTIKIGLSSDYVSDTAVFFDLMKETQEKSNYQSYNSCNSHATHQVVLLSSSTRLFFTLRNETNQINGESEMKKVLMGKD